MWLPQLSTLGDIGIQVSSTVRKAGLTHCLKGSQAPWMHSIGPQLQQSHSCSCPVLYNSLHNWVYDLLQIFSNTFQNLSVFSKAHLWELMDNFELTDSNRKKHEYSTLNIHWKDWCWSWSSNTLASWWEESTQWKRPWCWERLKAKGEGGGRGWDGLITSPTWWTWIWENSKR